MLVVCTLLWVTSFVDTGYLKHEDEAKDIYQNLLLIAVGGCLLTGPLLVKISDSHHLGWSIGVSFFCRSMVFLFGFPFLPKPDSIMTFVVVTAML